MAQPLQEVPIFGRRVVQNTEHTGISDRSSTRLHAPPGGKQSINIFGGDEEAPVRVSKNNPPAAAPACMDKSMAAGGRVVQNTEYTGISERSSTRLHAPPGGKQSINIFGGGEEEPAPAKAPPLPRAVVDKAPTVVSGYGVSVAAGGRVVQNTEYTGISERSSTRLHAPPGGKQSINIFGGGGDEDEAPAKKPRAEPPVAAKPTETMAAGGRVVQNTEYTGISERSSTRLHAPPGGKQSINIFGGRGDEDEQDAAPETERQAPPAKEVAAPVAEPPIPAKPTQPATMAAGGRVAQNTEHTGIADKPSTRVHAPPGGASSMSSVFSQDVVSGSAADRMAALRSRRQESGTAWQARPF